MSRLEPLIASLDRKSRALNMTVEEFAEYIGIDRVTWWRFRTGKRRFNSAQIEMVLRRFPDLETPAFQYQRETGRLRLNGKKAT